MLVARGVGSVLLLIAEAHPVIVVDTGIAVFGHFERDFLGHRWLCGLLGNGGVTGGENKGEREDGDCFHECFSEVQSTKYRKCGCFRECMESG